MYGGFRDIVIGGLLITAAGLVFVLFMVTSVDMNLEATYRFIVQQAFGQESLSLQEQQQQQQQPLPVTVLDLVNVLNGTGDIDANRSVIHQNVDTWLYAILLTTFDDNFNNTYLREDFVSSVSSDRGFDVLMYDSDGDGKLVLVLMQQQQQQEEEAAAGTTTTTTTTAASNGTSNNSTNSTGTGSSNSTTNATATTTLLPSSVVDSDNDGTVDSNDLDANGDGILDPIFASPGGEGSISNCVFEGGTVVECSSTTTPLANHTTTQPPPVVTTSYNRTYKVESASIKILYDEITFRVNNDANIPLGQKRTILDTVGIDLSNRQYDLQAAQWQRSHIEHRIIDCWLSFVLYVNYPPNFDFDYNVDIPCVDNSSFFRTNTTTTDEGAGEEATIICPAFEGPFHADVPVVIPEQPEGCVPLVLPGEPQAEEDQSERDTRADEQAAGFDEAGQEVITPTPPTPEPEPEPATQEPTEEEEPEQSGEEQQQEEESTEEEESSAEEEEGGL